MRPYFGLTGGWLTFWVSVACSTDMTLFGYDQGVFGAVSLLIFSSPPPLTLNERRWCHCHAGLSRYS